MKTKTEIEPCTKFGIMTYVCDIEPHKNNRYVKMLCKCGRVKNTPYNLLARPEALSCGNVLCRNLVLLNLDKQLESKLRRIESLDIIIERKDYESKEDVKQNEDLTNLFNYWREIERTGNVHNIANGMVLTKQFLVN